MPNKKERREIGSHRRDKAEQRPKREATKRAHRRKESDDDDDDE